MSEEGSPCMRFGSVVDDSSSSDVDSVEAEKLRSVAIESSAVASQALSEHHRQQQSIRTKNLKQREAYDKNDAGISLKFYQTRALHDLRDYLDKTYEIGVNVGDFKEDIHSTESTADAGFHLFKCAPPGLLEKVTDNGSSKNVHVLKRKRHTEEGIDESSELFQSNVLAACIKGSTVELEAQRAVGKAFSSWMSEQARDKETKRLEDERVALLRQQRGERWLPSIARELGILMESGPMMASNMLTASQSYHNRNQTQTSLKSHDKEAFKTSKENQEKRQKLKKKEKTHIEGVNLT